MTSTYSHTAHCPNCSYRNAYAIPRGQTIDSYMRDQTCDNCGCDMVRACRTYRQHWERQYATPHAIALEFLKHKYKPLTQADVTPDETVPPFKTGWMKMGFVGGKIPDHLR